MTEAEYKKHLLKELEYFLNESVKLFEDINTLEGDEDLELDNFELVRILSRVSSKLGKK